MLLIDGNPQINLTSAVSELLTNAQYTTGAIIWQNFLVLRQRLWNGRKKRGQRERKMFYNARCVNKGL